MAQPAFVAPTAHAPADFQVQREARRRALHEDRSRASNDGFCCSVVAHAETPNALIESGSMTERDSKLLPLRDGLEDALADIVGHETPVAEPPDWLADAGIDLLIRLDNITLAVQVKAAPTVADVHRLASLSIPPGAYKVLAGGRVSQAVRAELRAAGIGFYDARGHLRLMRPPLRIDAPARAVTDDTAPTRDPLVNNGGLDVALYLLDKPDFLETFSVRGLARAVDRAPSTVSNTLKALRDDHLVDERNRPIVPDLFQAVLAHWQPKRLPLAGMPAPGQGRLNERLELGLDTVPLEAGWALADGHAAAAWGAPVVLVADTPPDFYIPSTRVLNTARTSFGIAAYGAHACTVAVAPAPFVVRFRYDFVEIIGLHFPVVRPVIAALDLAADPGRGRETLELWSEHLGEHITRVW